jgi:uridine kinase
MEKSSHLKPLVIGVTGGTASGKSYVCKQICDSFPDEGHVTLLQMDHFYKGLTPEQMADVSNYNFDEPAAFDWEAYSTALDNLVNKGATDIPVYCFKTHSRLQQTQTIKAGQIVIVEGILSLFDKKMRDMMDVKIYVEADADLRLGRRIVRDQKSRGRSLQSILQQYFQTVKPSFENYTLPCKKYADIIIPGHEGNSNAIFLVIQSIGWARESREYYLKKKREKEQVDNLLQSPKL